MKWVKIINGEIIEIENIDKPITMPGPDQIIQQELRNEKDEVISEAVSAPGEITYPVDMIRNAIENKGGWTIESLKELGIFQVEEPTIGEYENVVSSILKIENGIVVKKVQVEASSIVLRKSQMRSTITNKRNQKINGGFTYKGVTYQTGPDDRENIHGAYSKAKKWLDDGGDPDTVYWIEELPEFPFGFIALDNSITPMSATQVCAFASAFSVYKMSLIFYALSVKGAIDATTTHEELNAITSNNWPT